MKQDLVECAQHQIPSREDHQKGGHHKKPMKCNAAPEMAPAGDRPVVHICRIRVWRRDATRTGRCLEVQLEETIAPMLADWSRNIVGLQDTRRTDSPNHVLTRTRGIDAPTTPGAAISTLGIDDKGAIDNAASFQKVNLDGRGILRHDMAGAQARAECDILAILSSISDKNQGAFHLRPQTKGSPCLSRRSREVEE